MVEVSRGSGSDGPRAGHLGRYKLISRLGQGGMGTVYLAIASGLGEFRKPLVVKELRPELTRDDRFLNMFLSEAKLAAKLTHPNVVHTIEATQDGERYFLVMEFLDGQPLARVMHAAVHAPQLTLALRLGILCDTLAGLHYAHELSEYDGEHLGVVHRDVSPQNVFVNYDGQVKVVDFGIAKVAGLEDQTAPGVFKGRFGYAAPEQIRGQPVDRRADIFAVGVMMWEAVALQRLARGAATPEMVADRIAGNERKLSEALPAADPALAAICERAMESDPEQRYATAEAMRLALVEYLERDGQRQPSEKLGLAVREVFAKERCAVHKLIAPELNKLSSEEGTDSSVRRAFGAEPAPLPVSHPPMSADELTPVSDGGLEAETGDVTMVTDLSALVEATRTDLPTMKPKPDRQRRWPMIAAALLSVTVLAALSLWLSDGEDVSQAAPQGETAGAPQQDPPEAEAPAPKRPEPDAVGDADQAGTADSADSPSANANAGESLGGQAAVHPLAEQVLSPAQRAARRVRYRRNQAAREANRQRAADQAGQTAAAPSAQATEVQLPAANAYGAHAPVGVGVGVASDPVPGRDLHEFRTRERRRLDLEDPFE